VRAKAELTRENEVLLRQKGFLSQISAQQIVVLASLPTPCKRACAFDPRLRAPPPRPCALTRPRDSALRARVTLRDRSPPDPAPLPASLFPTPHTLHPP